MKASFSLFSALVMNLLVFGHSIVSAEIFTEGVEVSPETVTLKPGEYVWEPERAPEGPLLIVASITEQVAYVYRNGIRIARSSAHCTKPRPTRLLSRTPVPGTVKPAPKAADREWTRETARPSRSTTQR